MTSGIQSATAGPADRPYMNWFREARFGMFVHFGPFSQWFRKEWRDMTAALREPQGVSAEEPARPARASGYNRRLVEGLTPVKGCARQWAELAKKAGMKYIVFTAKHHEGFCLWDSRLTDFNSARMGPKYDMVADYVSACRQAGLRVGLYYSLMDGHHPDGRLCAHDEAARQRFLEFTRGLLRELMTNYGKIDILWYDGPSPLGYASEWESVKMNRMVRDMQPGIIINDRALTSEDFTCSEGKINPPLFPDHDWEACMTFNGTWTYNPTEGDRYLSARQIIEMLNKVSAMSGNLLLNVAPSPDDGSVGPIETERLTAVGRWLARFGEAAYGHVDRVDALGGTKNQIGASWSRRGNTAYLWLLDWPKGDVLISDVKAKVNACRLIPDGRALQFDQKDGQLAIRSLPEACPDAECQFAVLKIEFASYPR